MLLTTDLKPTDTESLRESVTRDPRAKRDYEQAKAQYDTEVNTAKAEAELAYSLQVLPLVAEGSVINGAYPV